MTGKFTLELGDFSFVKGYTGKMLRLSVTWKFTEQDTGAVLGITTEGCLVSRRSDGTLTFATPGTPWGRNRMKHLQLATPDLKRTIIELVERSRFAEHIGKEVPDAMKAVLAKSVDATLPTNVTAEIPTIETEVSDELSRD